MSLTISIERFIISLRTIQVTIIVVTVTALIIILIIIEPPLLIIYTRIIYDEYYEKD